MQALSLNEEKQLEMIETAAPQPAAGEVVVSVKAAALNHREIWITKGLYPGMTLPSTLGADGAGVVTAVGEGVDEAWLNEAVVCYPVLGWGESEVAPTKAFRLFGMPEPGFVAQKIAVPVENLVKKPGYLSFGEAAAIPVAGLTAWRALTRHGRIAAGDNVLITGIGGGVAQAGLGIAKGFGANVFVTSSQMEKIELAKGLGATAGFNYREEGWHNGVREVTGGIDIVLDGSPVPKFDDYLRFLNMGARVVVYGSTGSPKTTVGISRFFLRHISLIGTAMGTAQEFRDLIAFMTAHEIRPVIDRTFGFEQAIEAFHYLQAGNQAGKIVIEVG